MRLWIPSVSSRRITFSNRFQNVGYVLGGGGAIVGSASVDRGADLSGGGYIMFGARGADRVWALPHWSVRAIVDVPAAGSQRAVVSCGHTVMGNQFELGIQSTGELYVTGATTVESDSVVAPGRRDLLWVFSGSLVEFWADEARIGIQPLVLGSGSPTTLFVGAASDGASRKWGSSIYNLDVYSYPIDLWDPSSLWSAAAPGFWADLDAYMAVELNTQPDPRNSNFALWTGVNPDATPTYWTKTPTPGVAANHVEQAGNACHLISDSATNVNILKPAITGNRYDSMFTILTAVSGGVKDLTGVVFGTSPGAYRGDVTAPFALVGIARYSGVVANDITFTDAEFYNLSIAKINCKGLLGDLEQATASRMGWQKALGSKKSVYCDTADGYVLGTDKSTQRHFHDGTGVTFCCVVNLDVMTLSRLIMASASAVVSTGSQLYVGTDGRVQFTVYNSSGTAVLEAVAPAGAVAPGVPALVSFRMNSSGCEVWVDGVLLGSDYTITGAFGTGDAYSLLKVCAFASSYTLGLTGQIADPYSVAKYVTDAELAKLHRFFADKHGLKLATDPLTEEELETWDGLESWLDPSSAIIGYNTQPDVGGGTESDWTIHISGSKADVAGGGYTGGNAIEHTSAGAPGSGIMRLCLVLGNYYSLTAYGKGDGVSTPRSQVGYLTGVQLGAVTAWGSLSVEKTCTGEAKIYLLNADGTLSSKTYFSDIAATNLSIATIPERVGGGSYAQATALNMPWVDSTTGVIYNETSDALTSSKAASTFNNMHNGLGGTIVAVATLVNNTAAAHALTGTSSYTSSDGFFLVVSPTGTLSVYIRGGGADIAVVSSAGGTIATGTKYRVALRTGTSLGVLCRVDNTNVLSGSLVGASTADAALPLSVGGYSGGSSLAWRGRIYTELYFNRLLSNSELVRLDNFLASAY